MEAIFDKNRKLVSWFQVGNGHIFDTNMRFIAFTQGNGLFTPNSDRLGFYIDGVFRDISKKPVAFLADANTGAKMPDILPPVRPSKPTNPSSPHKPPLPERPPAPHGQFSPISWSELLLYDSIP